MIDVLYFASLREALGTGGERLALPDDTRVAGVIALLRTRGGVWAEVFDGTRPVLVAVNQTMADADSALSDGDELGFFPPVTGG